jgi:hypothetical protein
MGGKLKIIKMITVFHDSVAFYVENSRGSKTYVANNQQMNFESHDFQPSTSNRSNSRTGGR